MAIQYLLEQTSDGFNLREWVNRCPDYKSQVKRIRESLGMTQEQLAALVDRTPRSIRTIENGEAYPRITTLERIAGALNADMILLLVPRDASNEPAPEAAKPVVTHRAQAPRPKNIAEEEEDIVFGETD